MDKKQIWALTEETMRAFAPYYQEAMQKAIQDSGVPNQWFALSLARGSDPEPFTLERYQTMAPYSQRGRLLELLEALAQLELLERVGENAYRITDQGRETVEGIFKAAHKELGKIEPLPAAEMKTLNHLLQRLVTATLEAAKPEEKWSIAYSRWTDPGEAASGLATADQYLTDLIRFRDDAHIAAWKPYNVDGRAWEALTLVWRDEVHTAAALAERLLFRGYAAEDYAQALADLANQGWVQEKADGFHVTDKGRALRQEAEEATDRYFFGPWDSLNDAEQQQLLGLLTKLKESSPQP